MFKALITRLLGRTGSVRTQPEEAVATLGNSPAIGTPLNTPASPGVLPAAPSTQAAEPARRPSILSSYSPIHLTDNLWPSERYDNRDRSPGYQYYVASASTRVPPFR